MPEIFLGGRWKVLEEDNKRLVAQNSDLESKFSTLQNQFNLLQKENLAKTSKLREVSLLYSKLREHTDTVLNVKIQEYENTTIPSYEKQVNEQLKMEKEDMQSLLLRQSCVENQTTKRKVELELQGSELRKKLKDTSGKLKKYQENKQQQDSTILNLRGEVERLKEVELKRKNQLIQTLQKEKTTMFSELTRLRATFTHHSSTGNSSSNAGITSLDDLVKENRELHRKVHQMEKIMEKRGDGIINVTNGRNKGGVVSSSKRDAVVGNPWNDSVTISYG